MALDAVCRGMIIRGVGIHGPLVRLHADDEGGHLMPRWRWFGWLLFRDYRWSWSNVNRIDRLQGPFGGVRGLRIVLSARSEPTTRAGVVGPWFSSVGGFVMWLDSESTENLLALAPPNIPRADRRSLFVWS